MSLLGNQNNEFEKRLKKQLSDTEFKPTESLWNRIDSEVNRPDFEQKVEGKIGRFETAPKPETWEYIEAHLPPEPHAIKANRKVWYSLFILLFFVGGYAGLQMSNNNPIAFQETTPSTDVKEIGNDIKPAAPLRLDRNVPKETLTTGSEFKQKSISANTSKHSFHAIEHKTVTRVSKRKLQSKTGAAVVHQINQQTNPVNNSAVNNTDLTTLDSDNNLNVITAKNEEKLIIEEQNPAVEANVSSADQTIHQNNVTDVAAEQPALDNESKGSEFTNEVSTKNPDLMREESVTVTSVAIPDSAIVISDETKGKQVYAINDSTPQNITHNFSTINTVAPVKLSISIMAGLHQGRMLFVAPAGMETNKNLRKKTEQPDLDFSGGFLIDYKINKNILISTGFILNGFRMQMNYDVASSGRSARLEPGATYEHENDSIIDGKLMNNGIKYTWTEIPLLVTYRFYTKSKFGFEIKTGVSYAMLGTVDAAMIGQDNIGILIMKTKESFPVFQNSFFAHLYTGISYQLNETVCISASPYVKYSLNSMVKNEKWIQQHPLMTGLSLGLRKSF